MTQDTTFSLPPRGPLILGAGGRIGRAFRHLWQQGQWPEAAVPLWQSSQTLDHAETVHAGLDPVGLARIAVTAIGVRTRGIIVLAGATSGTSEELAANTQAAEAAVVLRALGVAGPILCLSSAAVYGRGEGRLDESAPLAPVNAYGAAKCAMEQAMARHQGVTCLRLANVAGCEGLLGAMGATEVALDRVADGTTADSRGQTGQGPKRSYIGPLTLARALTALTRAENLPPVLNLAQPDALPMEALLTAAKARWHWQDAPANVVDEVALDTQALAAHVTLPPADAATLVAEAVAAGWHNPQSDPRPAGMDRPRR